MPPENTPTTPVSQPTAKVEEKPVKKFFPLIVSEISYRWSSFVEKRKGKQKEGEPKQEFIQRVRPEFDMTAADPFAQIKGLIGITNHNRLVSEIYEDLADEAAQESIGADGVINIPTYALKFKDAATPGSRREGTGKKQLEEKITAVGAKLQPFWEKSMLLVSQRDWPKEKRTVSFTQEDELIMAQLMIEATELQKLYQKKLHKGVSVTAPAVLPKAA